MAVPCADGVVRPGPLLRPRCSLRLESIGGQWDAFTSKEATCYHGKVLEEHFETLADIFSDIVLSPSFPEDALRLERNVIREEIRSVNDAPEESTHELFFRTLFNGHPLSYPVTGCAGDIVGYKRKDLISFHRKTYTAANTLFGFVGNIPLAKVTSILDGAFRFGRKGRKRRIANQRIESRRVRSLRRPDWSQSHVCIGSTTVPVTSPQRYALAVLSNILGGGVSSRLFQSLRERSGLAYSVYSNASFWSDTGAFWTFFTVDPKNLPVALDIYHEEMSDMIRNGADNEEIESAKAQLKGMIVFGIENVNSRLFRLLHGEFYHGRYASPAEVIRAIDRVNRDSLAEASSAFLGGGRRTYVTCGPVSLRGLARRR